MAQESTKRAPDWTYAAASRTLPYVRLVLRNLRVQFIAFWHLYKVAGYDVTDPAYSGQLRSLGAEGRAALEELDHLGVIPYQSPLRGIVLFPFRVRDGKGGRREAYFVFKDTRDEIDSFIIADDLRSHNDLYGYEMPVPEMWKRPDVVPVPEEDARP